ncbi:unnamed protein product [Orchesella dallaii]|uniref:DNA replication complex GINS protein PSF3 n=1 Tax=Orchesella dallaii TaxID=48710 RepID=A0ABP1PYG3_9HEXA
MSTKELRKSFSPSYFALEDILASQTRVPCKTEMNLANCGFLDPSQENKDLAAGTQVELPIWAARVMSKQKRAFVSLRMPKFYSESYREVLKAEPAVVDLNKMGPHYYQSALQLCTLPSDEADKIAESLPDILQKRVIAMADSYSLHRSVKSTDDISNQLGNSLKFHNMDPLEVEIFNNSKNASEELDDWLRS